MPNEIVAAPGVAVCVLTRLRPLGLNRTLEGIAGLDLSRDDYSRLRVIVVDNDAELSAKTVCDRLRPQYRWPLDYIVEPISGIPHARNRALDSAAFIDDVIAFIDDDEVPASAWLSELLRVRREYTADVVFGPVGPYFPDPVPGWIERGKFFQRETHPTGSVCAVGATGNVLISTYILRESNLRFDESDRFNGGSDTVFFKRVHQAGYRMVWADNAFAAEWIPNSRTTIGWLARRYFRNGSNDGRVESLPRRLFVAALAIARVVLGLACAPLFLPFGRHRFVIGVKWICYGMGLLHGAAGKRFDEYQVIRSV